MQPSSLSILSVRPMARFYSPDATLPLRNARQWCTVSSRGSLGVITKDELYRIAALAKLSFDENHIEQFRAEFERIVEYVGALNRMSALDGLEPLDAIVPHTNAFADDVPDHGLSTEEALANAPRHNESFFKVPKVLAAAEWAEEDRQDAPAE